jgi:hypothetical protein
VTAARCEILELPKVSDPRGSLSFVEAGRHVPFAIKRIFYLYDVPVGQMRAAHALNSCQQFIVAISGSFDVIADDGATKERFRLDRADCGLHVPPLIWREIENFSANSVCLVLASEFYDAGEYIDDYAAFTAAIGAKKR